MTTTIVLDTDIGSDIDDALCLSYLLARTDCELVGITTVSGRAEERAMLASALCRAAGREVPIFVGAAEPLLVPQRQPDVPQAPALESWAHDIAFPGWHAVDFMRQLIHEDPGEVVLLAIGPLTNVALLFALDPGIPAMLRGLVSMAGSFSGPRRPEWNVVCDPHAAAIVYRAPVPYHLSVGLDITTQVQLDVDEFRGRLHARRLRPVLDFAAPWVGRRKVVTFHDPLAGAVVFEPGICDFADGTVEVGTKDGHGLGVTRFSRVENGRHRVAVGVDAARFFEHYFDVLG